MCPKTLAAVMNSAKARPDEISVFKELPIPEIYSTLLPERHELPKFHSHLLLRLSQRIAAVDLAPGLQYFGRSIHGTMDMNNDGSVDLAVGSLGAAVLLWLVFGAAVCARKSQSLGHL